MYDIKVIINDKVKILQAGQDEILLNLLRNQEVEIVSPCSGKGTCGKCKVKVVSGDAGHMTESEDQHLTDEEVEEGLRLACMIKVKENITIEVPEEENDTAVILLGDKDEYEAQPVLTKQYIELEKPSVNDQRSDVQRLEDALSCEGEVDIYIMKELESTLRENDFKVTSVCHLGRLIAIEGGDTTEKQYGIAVDVGTTTIAGFLIDLKTGKQIDVYSSMNPQRPFGADVISRMDYAKEHSTGLDHLQSLVVKEINEMVAWFVRKDEISNEDIYDITVVGNTVMMHIFAGIPVQNIAISPFIPVVTRKVELSSLQMGLNVNKSGKVTVLPMVAGYVGADTVGCILSCDIHRSEKINLMIDIGTNGEIALGNKDSILACSTAAGPAFEGAHIQFGMGGVAGAINTMRIDGDVEYTTIGNRKARGICGSGLVDSIAEMLRIGLVDMMGKIISKDEADDKFPKAINERLCDYDGKPAFLIARESDGAMEDIFVCQKDLREVQLAKGAIAAGVEILIKEADISMDDIDTVYLAGGFGNYINHDFACDINLIPRPLRDKIVPVGNAAGDGAKMALANKHSFKDAEDIRANTKYIELSTRMDFQTIFVDYMLF